MFKFKQNRYENLRTALTIGIIVNILLFLLKLFSGIKLNSIAVKADAFNNLSDAGMLIISIIGLKISMKNSNAKYPYGFGRIEYIATLIVGVVILLVAYEFITESVTAIIHPTDLNWNLVVILSLCSSIFIKLFLMIMFKAVAKAENSKLMAALSFDSFSDCISTAVIIIATIVVAVTGFKINGYIGILTAAFVGYNGIKIVIEQSETLIGAVPSRDIVEKIIEMLDNSELLGYHNLELHDYGPNKILATLHGEISDEKTIAEAHEIIHDIEHLIKFKTNVEIVIHADPVSDNEFYRNLKKEVKDIVFFTDSALKIHDFRTENKGENVIIRFDLKFYGNYTQNMQEKITEDVKNAVEKLDEKYICKILVDVIE